MPYIDELEGLTFQQLVLRRLDALGMTQKELANRVGVDPGSVNRWCNNEQRLIDSSKRPDLVPRLALALRVPMTSICDAFDRSGIFLPSGMSDDVTSGPEWIEQDVLPEMEAWMQTTVRNPAFAKDPKLHMVNSDLYSEWFGRNVEDGVATIRFPVSGNVALRWYEAQRLDPYASMPMFLARTIMTSASPAPYPFAGEECDETLDRMRDYVNTKMVIIDRLCAYPDTAIGDDHVEEQMLFLEMFCHVHTKWELTHDEDGSHIPIDPFLVGADKAAVASLNASWRMLYGKPAPESEIREMLDILPKQYAEQIAKLPPRCAVAFNR